MRKELIVEYMKSRYKKEIKRSIISRIKEIGRNPNWYGDSGGDFYAPYINEVASFGLCPEAWSFEKGGVISGLSCSFVYSYLSSSDRSRSGFSSVSIISKGNPDFKDIVYRDESMSIYVNDAAYGSVGLLFGVEVATESLAMALPKIADYLTDFHKARILFIGARKINVAEDIRERGIMVAILGSYWDYAKGGVTHMYRMRMGDAKDEDFDIDNMFERFEISEEEVMRQCEEYERLSLSIVRSCGERSFKGIELQMAKDKEQRRES